MAQNSRPRWTWNEQADGSMWLPVELNGARGVVAIVEAKGSRLSATVLFDVALEHGADAKAAVETWLIQVKAGITD